MERVRKVLQSELGRRPFVSVPPRFVGGCDESMVKVVSVVVVLVGCFFLGTVELA